MVSRVELHKKKKKSVPYQMLLFLIFFLSTSSVVYVGYQFISKENNEVIKETTDGKLPSTQLKISINAFPTFEDGKSSGTLSIKNDITNRYNMIVEIYLVDNEELVYKSPTLAPGKIIRTGQLKVDLAKGEYEAIAYFKAYTTNTNKYAGQSAAKIKLVIES